MFYKTQNELYYSPWSYKLEKEKNTIIQSLGDSVAEFDNNHFSKEELANQSIKNMEYQSGKLIKLADTFTKYAFAMLLVTFLNVLIGSNLVYALIGVEPNNTATIFILICLSFLALSVLAFRQKIKKLDNKNILTVKDIRSLEKATGNFDFPKKK